jgi:hypothetical protein
VNSHELYAELERCRRDIATLRHRLPLLENPDFVDGLRARLERAEAEERDLLQQLAELEKPAAARKR